MNPIIKELLVNNIPVTMQYNKEKEKIEYEISGFYKSGNIKLIENTDGILEAHSRYGQVDTIKEFRDIVWLNYEWWMSSKDRFDGWSNPESNWLPLLLKEGIIKEETKLVKSYS